MKGAMGFFLILLLFNFAGMAGAEMENEEPSQLERYETPWSEIERLVEVPEDETEDQGKLSISGDYTISYKIVFPSEEMKQESYSYWTDRLNLDLTYQISDYFKVGIRLRISDILIDP